MPRTAALLVTLTILVAACESPEVGQVDATATAATVPLYMNLGDHSYTITTDVPETQEYFDQGLRLTYAFNHPEAIRAFREGARLDPDCAMCYWGIAYAYGPNINAAMDSASGVEAYAAAQMALERAGNVSEVERALIEAVAQRYGPDPLAGRERLDSAFAAAMGEVAERFPDNHEVATLYAESLMDLSPWYYWNADGSPRPATPAILASLERVIEEDPHHPGACHFYIHAVEAAHPERAVPCAERLATLMPGAGHLVHMPGHIYIRVGRYADAIEANQHAVHADETFIADQRPGYTGYVLGYYPHNYDFLAFAAMMAGQGDLAIESAQKVQSLIPADMLGQPGLSFLEQGYTGPLRMLVRFGRWDDILALPEPEVDRPYVRGTWHYARGMANAAKGDFAAAEADLAQVREAAAHPDIAEASIGFNPGGTVLTVAAGVLAGEIAARRVDTTEAVRLLTEAARLEDSFTYGEPPDWPVPVRHHLGAVLLEAGRTAEAERAYREDLVRFPENGWSLFGLAESLRRQGRAEEAAQVEERLRSAWASSDVTLTGSRF